MNQLKETPAALAGAVGVGKETQIHKKRITNSFHANKKKALEILPTTTLPKTDRRANL